MAQVAVTIAGRLYRMACGDGEEAHLESLAQDLDRRITELRGSFGEIGDQRLVVMAAIGIADEHSEATRRIGALQADLDSAQQQIAQADRLVDAWVQQAAEGIHAAAARLEAVAGGTRDDD